MRFYVDCKTDVGGESFTFSVIVQNWRSVRRLMRAHEVSGVTKVCKRFPKFCGHVFHKRLMKYLESSND